MSQPMVIAIVVLIALLTFGATYGWMSFIDRLAPRTRKYLLLAETVLLLGVILFFLSIGWTAPRYLLILGGMLLVHILKVYFRRGWYFGKR